MSRTETRSSSRNAKGRDSDWREYLKSAGPGLVTGASDDEGTGGMRRFAVLLAVSAAIGGIAFVLMRRASAPRGEPMPAPASAPVHMAVGESAPEVTIPGEADTAVP